MSTLEHNRAEFPALEQLRRDQTWYLSERAGYDLSKTPEGRKQIEQALRVSEEKFAKVFHSSPMFVSISTVAEGRYAGYEDTAKLNLPFQGEWLVYQGGRNAFENGYSGADDQQFRGHAARPPVG